PPLLVERLAPRGHAARGARRAEAGVTGRASESRLRLEAGGAEPQAARGGQSGRARRMRGAKVDACRAAQVLNSVCLSGMEFALHRAVPGGREPFTARASR